MGRRFNYRRIVPLVSFGCTLLCASQAFVVGVYHVAFVRHFRQDSALTAWVGAISLGLLGVGSPIASSVINRWDCRTCIVLSGFLVWLGHVISAFAPDLWILFISHGLISGLGFCLCFQGSLVCMALWFRDKPSGVTGLALAGASIGTIVFARLTQVFIDHYGLAGALLLNGAIAFHACALGMLVRLAPFEVEKRRQRRLASNETKPKTTCLPWLRSTLANPIAVCRNPALAVLALAAYCIGIGFGLSLVHMAQLYVWKGMTPQAASMSVSLYGLAATISRLLVGGLANSIPTGKAVLLGSLCGLAAISDFLVPVLTSSYAGMFAHAVLLGFNMGSILVVIGPVILESVPPKHTATAYGVCFMAVGCGSLSLQLFTRITEDLILKYYIAGGMYAAACLTAFASYVFAAHEAASRGREATVATPSLEEVKPMVELSPVPDAVDCQGDGEESRQSLRNEVP